jgi:hypothetical protein
VTDPRHSPFLIYTCTPTTPAAQEYSQAAAGFRAAPACLDYVHKVRSARWQHKAAEGARSEPRWGFARLTPFTLHSSAFTLQLSAAGLREAHALIVGGAAAACGARAHPGEYLQVAN